VKRKRPISYFLLGFAAAFFAAGFADRGAVSCAALAPVAEGVRTRWNRRHFTISAQV
jgi:hypothetical protein